MNPFAIHLQGQLRRHRAGDLAGGVAPAAEARTAVGHLIAPPAARLAGAIELGGLGDDPSREDAQELGLVRVERFHTGIL